MAARCSSRKQCASLLRSHARRLIRREREREDVYEPTAGSLFFSISGADGESFELSYTVYSLFSRVRAKLAFIFSIIYIRVGFF